MEEKANIIETLIEKIEAYGKTSIDLFKLKVIEKAAETVSSFVVGSTVVILAIIFLLFGNVALAYWLGEILGRTFLGFLIVAGFYFFLVILIGFVFNKSFKKAIGNKVVRKLS